MITDEYAERAEKALASGQPEEAQVWATLAVVRAIQTAHQELAFHLGVIATPAPD